MAWIESHQQVGDHPKTKKLARKLGISIPAAVGHLHFLWWWALDYAQDGALERYDSDDISDAMRWDGDPDALVAALLDVGYVDLADNGYVIHDWWDYAGKLIERREKDRARKQNSSIKTASEEFRRNSNGKSTDSMRTQQYPTVPNSTEPYHIPPISPEGGDAAEDRFDQFWKIYPKKVGKKNARQAWKRAKIDEATFEKIMKAVDVAKRSDQWNRNNGQYIPNPSTWINQGRWDDEPTEKLGGEGSFDTDEFFEASLRRSYEYTGGSG